jgi:hypothetical protein
MGKTSKLSNARMRVSFLLHYRWLLLTHTGQPVLNQTSELFLPAELDLRVPRSSHYAGRL